MSIVDIFWKRQKRLREETPDIYEYATYRSLFADR